VTCAKQGDGAPFFLCHGDFVTLGLWAFRLVDMLRCNRPVFLVWPHPDAKLSIEEMAKSYLPHLLAAQPSGAFCFGGFCNGGVLAWELAHQLETLGREIEYVVLIDTRCRGSSQLISNTWSGTVLDGAAPKQATGKASLWKRS